MTEDKTVPLIQVPRWSTNAMAEAAFRAAGSPSDWNGFAEMWDAAIAAWEKETTIEQPAPFKQSTYQVLTEVWRPSSMPKEVDDAVVTLLRWLRQEELQNG